MSFWLVPGVFDDDRYWDIVVEYAKNTSQDILCRLSVHNRGPEPATLHVLPTLWFRNTWIWGCQHEGCTTKPKIALLTDFHNALAVKTKHDTLEEFICEWEDTAAKSGGGDSTTASLLFTENETNSRKLYGVDNYTPYVKDAFHRYVIHGEKEAVSAKGRGTKVAAHHVLTVPAGGSAVVRVRFYQADHRPEGENVFGDFDGIFERRRKEANEFYGEVCRNDNGKNKFK